MPVDELVPEHRATVPEATAGDGARRSQARPRSLLSLLSDPHLPPAAPVFARLLEPSKRSSPPSTGCKLQRHHKEGRSSSSTRPWKPRSPRKLQGHRSRRETAMAPWPPQSSRRPPPRDHLRPDPFGPGHSRRPPASRACQPRHCCLLRSAAPALLRLPPRLLLHRAGGSCNPACSPTPPAWSAACHRCLFPVPNSVASLRSRS